MILKWIWCSIDVVDGFLWYFILGYLHRVKIGTEVTWNALAVALGANKIILDVSVGGLGYHFSLELVNLTFSVIKYGDGVLLVGVFDADRAFVVEWLDLISVTHLIFISQFRVISHGPVLLIGHTFAFNSFFLLAIYLKPWTTAKIIWLLFEKHPSTVCNASNLGADLASAVHPLSLAGVSAIHLTAKLVNILWNRVESGLVDNNLLLSVIPIILCSRLNSQCSITGAMELVHVATILLVEFFLLLDSADLIQWDGIVHARLRHLWVFDSWHVLLFLDDLNVINVCFILSVHCLLLGEKVIVVKHFYFRIN